MLLYFPSAYRVTVSARSTRSARPRHQTADTKPSPTPTTTKRQTSVDHSWSFFVFRRRCARPCDDLPTLEARLREMHRVERERGRSARKKTRHGVHPRRDLCGAHQTQDKRKSKRRNANKNEVKMSFRHFFSFLCLGSFDGVVFFCVFFCVFFFCVVGAVREPDAARGPPTGGFEAPR